MSVCSVSRAVSTQGMFGARGRNRPPAWALILGAEPQHWPSKPSTVHQSILVAAAAPFPARPRFIRRALQSGSQGGSASLGAGLAPLAQRQRSPPGGPRPAREASEKGSEGRGAEAPALGKPESAGALPLLSGTGGSRGLGSLGRGSTAERAPLRWVCPFPALWPSSREELLRASILFPKIRFLSAVFPALEVQLCGWGAGRGSGGWGSGTGRSTSSLHPPGGGGPRERGGRAGGVPTGRGRRRDWLTAGRRSCADAPGSPPLTRALPFTRLVDAEGVRFRWDPSGAEQKTFPFPTPGSFLSFWAVATPELGVRSPAQRAAPGDRRGQERSDSVRPMAAAGGPATLGGHGQRRAPPAEAAAAPPARG